MMTMFAGTYAVAKYWSEVPQKTCVTCGITKPATLFPEMVSGTRRSKCAGCIAVERAERGNKFRGTTGRGSREALEDFMLQNSK